MAAGLARVVELPRTAETKASFRAGDSWCRLSTMELRSGIRLGVTECWFEPSFSFAAAQPAAEIELVVSKGGVLRARLANGQELRYTVAGERILEAELLEGGRTVHEVTLTPGDTGVYPREATYKNLAAYRELKLTTRSIENVASFPTDIWFPGP